MTRSLLAELLVEAVAELSEVREAYHAAVQMLAQRERRTAK